MEHKCNIINAKSIHIESKIKMEHLRWQKYQKGINETKKKAKAKPKKSQDRNAIARAMHIIWLARKCISKQNA